jgi:hypothetical protein
VAGATTAAMMQHILKSVRRRVLALSLVVLVGGAPEAMACALACSEPASKAGAGRHHHDQHTHHQPSAAVPDVGMEATPHDCGRGEQLPRVAEPLSKAKAQVITSSVIALEPLSHNAPRFFSAAAQRPPGSRFLSAQLRI